MALPVPLEQIASDIQKAIDADLPYLAVIATLTIPDLCSACETYPPYTVGERYKAWVENYLVGKIPLFTADDCYRLRCGVIHQGNFGRPDARYDMVIYSYGGGTIHGGSITCETSEDSKTILPLSVQAFFEAMLGAAKAWYLAKKGDVVVEQNLSNIIQRRPEGIEIMGVMKLGVSVLA
jgi:hypothetical protein